MATKCRSCGAPIVWGITKKCNRVPLDPPEKRFVPICRGDMLNLPPGDIPEVEMRETWLSHFATCPDADKHRRKP